MKCAGAFRISALAWCGAGLFAANVRPIDFDRQIRPILSDNCFACHGPDERQRMAGLRFDVKEGAFLDRGKYKIIVPGNSGASRLYARVSDANTASRMPPPNSGHTLTAPQIQAIRDWIDQGAEWKTHWAYISPRRPDPPSAPDAKWVHNPIDRFVLARLERDGLKPSPEAGRATLLRRLSFDLTGLPPTSAEIDAFLKDRSSDAYEKQVDRLLHSPHYGERMAMQWLDLARYADTHGYHIDSHRDMWPWRDWVIQAFQSNMPFDRFTVEQIAGDLLPHPTREQRIATGFNRNHVINFEGGAIPEEYQQEYVMDRVDATATAFLGMTMACARCHDHKYDPIKQKDFYAFAAFFNTLPEKGLDGTDGNAQPMLQLPNADEEGKKTSLEAQIKQLKEEIPEEQLAEMLAAWAKTRAGQIAPGAHDGLQAHYEFDGNLADSSGHYQRARAIKGDPAFNAGAVDSAVNIDGETLLRFGSSGAFERSDAFSLALWVKATPNRQVAVLTKLENAAGRRGYELLLDAPSFQPHRRQLSHVRFRLSHAWPADAIEIRTKDELLLGEWHALALTYDGSGKASGITMYADGKPVAIEILTDRLTGSVRTEAPLETGNTALGPTTRGQLDDLRIYGRVLRPEEVSWLAVQEPARATLLIAEAKRDKAQKQRLRDYFFHLEAPENFRGKYAGLMALEARLSELNKSILNTMVMEEMKEPRKTYILGRGDYRNHGDVVTPDVPAVLPPLAKDAPRNRLGLAKWLVDPGNPLTARVAVNHFWQMYFGMGLVKTAEDFGSQGESPTHPELLDWMATEFIRSGWDMRAMQRLIVTSATYRQTSRLTPELRERDPENRLYARGPRFRLPAEMVRDNALAVSGLLNPAIGGASVLPYQPPGLWEALAFGSGFTAQSYVQSHGQDLYRRSMYTFWKRTSPPASMVTFDAPNREKCVARRAVTNTPLQALVLENDPTYVEAARTLAAHTIRNAGAGPAKRIEFAFLAVMGRRPTSPEMAILREVAERQGAVYGHDREKALKLVAVGESPAPAGMNAGELAAWTNVASVILNLDETITKE